jgi:hypothetical protein
VEQEEVELLEKGLEKPAPAIREAKVEICFLTWLLPQEGQITSSVEAALRTRSSKGCSHSVQINSKIGIQDSAKRFYSSPF